MKLYFINLQYYNNTPKYYLLKFIIRIHGNMLIVHFGKYENLSRQRTHNFKIHSNNITLFAKKLLDT